MFAYDDDSFGECGMGSCADCAALPSCPSARKKAGKMKERTVKAYRITPVKGKKGLVTISQVGTVKCGTRTPIKQVKAGKGKF